jgi:hypothetical protein
MLSHHGAGALEAPAIVGNNAIVRSTDSPVASTNPLSCSLGPTVTSRDGTCVHLPGYCQEWTFGEWGTLAKYCVTTIVATRGSNLGR